MIKVQDWMASIPDGEKHIAYVGEGSSEIREFLLCGDGWETYKNWTFHLDMAFDPESITTRDTRHVVETHSRSNETKGETAVNKDESVTEETYTVHHRIVEAGFLSDVAHLEKKVEATGICLTWTVLRQHTALPGKLWATLRAVGSTAEKVKKSAIMVFEVDAAVSAIPASTPAISEMEQMENRVAHMVDVATYQAQLAQGALAETEQSLLICQDVAREVADVEETVKASTAAAEAAAQQAATERATAANAAAAAGNYCAMAAAYADNAEAAVDAAQEAVGAAQEAATAAETARKNAGSALNKCSNHSMRCEDAQLRAEDAKTAAQGAREEAQAFANAAEAAARRAETAGGGGGDSYAIHETADHSVAIADENGNVVVAIKPNGEKVGFGGGTSGDGVAFDYTKCGLPVLYLNGDTTDMTKETAVELNYTVKTAKGTTIASGICECKWQGSSSVSRNYPKKNYTIKFYKAEKVDGELVKNPFDATRLWPYDSERVTNFPNKDGAEVWGQQYKYCLKANWIDPSHVRNVVCAKLWGQVVASRCDKYKDEDTGLFVDGTPQHLVRLDDTPNYGAIDGFPCIIALNGAFFGLYTFNIPKDDWTFHMGDGEAEYVVACESNSNNYPSCRFAGLASFVEDANGNVDYAIEVKPKDAADETVIGSFNAAIGEVMNSSTSSAWETDVAPFFDVDAAIDYLIFVCCIGARDNLRKNALYATYDGVKWFMSAYDLDTTFGANVYAKGWYPVVGSHNQFAESCAMHLVFDRIVKYSKDKLKARYKELREGILSDENVWYMLNNFVNDIPMVVYNADAERWTSVLATRPLLGSTSANVDNYMNYYRMHCAYLDKEIEAL